MDKISKSSLNLENKVSTRNNKISSNITKFNTNKNEVEIEFVNSFGDAVLDALGSNKITKSTAVDAFESEGLEFIDKGDIKEAIRSGVNGENLKITLDNGDVYIFGQSNNSYKLLNYISDGHTVTFDNGLEDLYNNIYGPAGNNKISSINMVGDTLLLKLEDGTYLFFDTANNNKLTTISSNGRYYYMDDVKDAIDAMREDCIDKNSEWIRRNNSNDEIARIYEEENEWLEKCTYENIEKIEIGENGIMFITMKGSDKRWSIIFKNNKPYNATYWASDTNENYYNF